MNALAFLFIALVLSGIGSAVLILRNRRPTSVESGIDEFRREMSALAPPVPPRPMRRSDRDLGRVVPGAESELAPSGEPEVSPAWEDPTTDEATPSPADPRTARPDEPEVP